MFRCGKCNRVTAPHEKATMLVVETRDHEHRSFTYYKRGMELRDNGGAGTQIVKEIRVCASCI
jgi:hypothetical protein